MGAPYEGQAAPVEIDERQPLQITDDTQLTLATCESIAVEGDVDPESIAEHFADWFRAGRFVGLGASTYKSVCELAHGGHWALVGRKGEQAAGAGPASRIAPLAFCLSPEVDSDRQRIRDVCRITHHHEEAYAGALAVLIAVKMAASGQWQGPGALTSVAARLPDSRVRDRLGALADACPMSPLEVAAQFGNSGYVVDAVPLALYAAASVAALGFEVCLRDVIRAGGDTDTIASIAGQVMGTFAKFECLPDELVSALPEQKMLHSTFGAFANAVDR